MVITDSFYDATHFLTHIIYDKWAFTIDDNEFNKFLSDFAKEFSIGIYFDYDSGDIEYTLSEHQLLLFELISEDLHGRFSNF